MRIHHPALPGENALLCLHDKRKIIVFSARAPPINQMRPSAGTRQNTPIYISLLRIH